MKVQVRTPRKAERDAAMYDVEMDSVPRAGDSIVIGEDGTDLWVGTVASVTYHIRTDQQHYAVVFVA